MARMGRPSIFAPKDPKYRYQGLMTKEGATQFEAARKELAKLTALKVKQVSDGDVFEYLSRGREATVEYLDLATRT
jgi:hypothetical protein